MSGDLQAPAVVLPEPPCRCGSDQPCPRKHATLALPGGYRLALYSRRTPRVFGRSGVELVMRRDERVPGLAVVKMICEGSKKNNRSIYLSRLLRDHVLLPPVQRCGLVSLDNTWSVNSLRWVEGSNRRWRVRRKPVFYDVYLTDEAEDVLEANDALESEP